MTNYKYKARDKYGKAVSGVMNGEDKSAIARHLSNMGYIPISVEEVKETAPGISIFFKLFRAVKLEEVNAFTRQFVTLQRAGIPILVSLDTLEKQTKNPYFKDVIKEIVAQVEGGSSLSEALAKHPAIFSDLYVNMVKAGEASGLLDEILERLAEFGEKELDTRSRIETATRYPVMVLFALFFAFIVLVTVVIPKFANIFSQFKVELPLPTRILLGLSRFMQDNWHLCIVGAILISYAFYRYINTSKGRLQWDTFKLKTPVFGQLVYMLVMSRFTRTMSILMRSGLPIIQTFDMVSGTVANALISQAIEKMSTSVREGKGMSEPMRLSGVFPPIVVQMVAVGEDTGKVDELLMKLSEYYDQQSDYMIKNLTTLIEPIFILILGIMVLTMALAIFLPMWNMAGLFRR